MKKYEKILIEQGTDEWKALRRKKATASQIPALLGICPYREWNDILLEKRTGEEPEINSFKKVLFERAHNAERAAREYLGSNMGLHLEPAVLVSSALPDLMASLDGLSESENVIFEAKYMGKKNLALAKEGYIQPHHMVQIQAQLLVSGAKKCVYFATDNSGDAAVIDVEPNHKSFSEIAEVVQRFMKEVRKS